MNKVRYFYEGEVLGGSMKICQVFRNNENKNIASQGKEN